MELNKEYVKTVVMLFLVTTNISSITNEQIKYSGDTQRTYGYKIIESENIPKEWQTSITIMMHKKVTKKDPANYRGITNTNGVKSENIYRDNNTLQDQVPMRKEQHGFRKNRSTTSSAKSSKRSLNSITLASYAS